MPENEEQSMGANPQVSSSDRRVPLFVGLCIAAILMWLATRCDGFAWIVLSLPVIAAAAAGYLTRRWRKGRFIAIASVSLLGAMPFVALMVMMAHGFRKATETVTDVSQYSDKLENYWRPGAPDLVAHFPPSIPFDARNVRFSFTPKFLMGGARLQLRLATTPERLKELRDEFSRKRTISYDYRGHAAGVSDKNQIPLPTFATGEGDERHLELPEDFDLMFLDEFIPESEMAKSAFFWNHGQTHGVAFSDKRGEILYWAEAW